LRWIVVLVVVGGLFAYAIFGDRLPFGPLAAPRVTPRPTPSAAPVSPTPAPTAEAWRNDPSHPVNLFSALMTSTDASYHLDTKVTVSYLTSQEALGESWDVSGPDLTYLITYNESSGVAKRRAIRKGDELYVKEGDKPWVEQVAFEKSDIFGALNNDAYSKLTFVGQEQRNGKTAYHLTLPVAGFPYASTETLVITGAPSVSSWDVWVDEAGKPLSAAMHAGFNGVIERRSIPIQMGFEYTFSKVGEPVEIEVPPAFR
jgi:hypothetical protein